MSNFLLTDFCMLVLMICISEIFVPCDMPSIVHWEELLQKQSNSSAKFLNKYLDYVVVVRLRLIISCNNRWTEAFTSSDTASWGGTDSKAYKEITLITASNFKSLVWRFQLSFAKLQESFSTHLQHTWNYCKNEEVQWQSSTEISRQLITMEAKAKGIS